MIKKLFIFLLCSSNIVSGSSSNENEVFLKNYHRWEMKALETDCENILYHFSHIDVLLKVKTGGMSNFQLGKHKIKIEQLKQGFDFLKKTWNKSEDMSISHKNQLKNKLKNDVKFKHDKYVFKYNNAISPEYNNLLKLNVRHKNIVTLKQKLQSIVMDTDEFLVKKQIQETEDFLLKNHYLIKELIKNQEQEMIQRLNLKKANAIKDAEESARDLRKEGIAYNRSKDLIEGAKQKAIFAEEEYYRSLKSAKIAIIKSKDTFKDTDFRNAEDEFNNLQKKTTDMEDSQKAYLKTIVVYDKWGLRTENFTKLKKKAEEARNQAYKLIEDINLIRNTMLEQDIKNLRQERQKQKAKQTTDATAEAGDLRVAEEERRKKENLSNYHTGLNDEYSNLEHIEETTRQKIKKLAQIKQPNTKKGMIQHQVTEIFAKIIALRLEKKAMLILMR